MLFLVPRVFFLFFFSRHKLPPVAGSPTFSLRNQCESVSLPLGKIHYVWSFWRFIPVPRHQGSLEPSRRLHRFCSSLQHRPSQEVPVIVRSEDHNEVKPMRWGLVPSWAQDRSIGQRMIHARSETLLEKSSFKNLVPNRRCLVSADGFYEWRREGNRKVPMWIHLKKREPFAFAGLWDCWLDRDAGNRLYTFTRWARQHTRRHRSRSNESECCLHRWRPARLPIPEYQRLLQLQRKHFSWRRISATRKRLAKRGL